MIIKTVERPEDLETTDENGVYYVHKRNCVGQFSFGKSGTWETSEEALMEARKFVNNRKDKDSLRISYIPWGYLG